MQTLRQVYDLTGGPNSQTSGRFLSGCRCTETPPGFPTISCTTGSWFCGVPCPFFMGRRRQPATITNRYRPLTLSSNQLKQKRHEIRHGTRRNGREHGGVQKENPPKFLWIPKGSNMLLQTDTPGRIRTSNLRLRKPTIYPVDLRGRLALLIIYSATPGSISMNRPSIAVEGQRVGRSVLRSARTCHYRKPDKTKLRNDLPLRLWMGGRRRTPRFSQQISPHKTQQTKCRTTLGQAGPAETCSFAGHRIRSRNTRNDRKQKLFFRVILCLNRRDSIKLSRLFCAVFSATFWSD